MWVRIGSFKVKENQGTALRETYNGQAIPRVRAEPGNLGCLLLEPADEGEAFIVMTVWKDRASADAYESSGAAAEVVALVRSYFAGPPTLHSFESASVAGLPSQP